MNPHGDLNLKIVNRISEALLYSAVDILGQQVIEEKLKADMTLSAMFSVPVFSMADLLELLTLLLHDYNPVAAQGFSQRIGKVFFHYLRRNRSDEIMNNSLEYRLLPFHQRVEKALELFFQWLKREMNLNYSISKQNTGWQIQLEPPVVKQDHALFAFFFKGILLENFDWMDCHYRYTVDFSGSTKEDHQLVCFNVSYLPLE